MSAIGRGLRPGLDSCWLPSFRRGGSWQGWAESRRVLFGPDFLWVSHCISGFPGMWALDTPGAPSNSHHSFSQLLWSR